MIVRFFLAIPHSVNRISYPMASELWSKKKYNLIGRVLNICMRYSFVIVTILGLLIIFFGKLIIKFAFPGHPEFLLAYIPLIILIISATIRSTVLSISGIFAASGRPDITLKIGIITASFNITLNIILIPYYGINGAALATAIAMAISSLIMFVWLKKINEISLDLNWFIIGFPLFFIIIIIYFLLQDFFNPYLLTIFLFPTYIIIIYIVKIFTQEDTQYLKETLFKS
jgi:stage V sporulation protein B